VNSNSKLKNVNKNRLRKQVVKMGKVKPAFKVWFETKGSHLFGQGTIKLLEKVGEEGTLGRAAKEMGMSYRYAWGLIREAEKKIGEALIKTYKGGMYGGGGAKLTEKSLSLIRQYSRIEALLTDLVEDELSWEGLFVKISARNRIEGEVISVEKGDVAAKIKISVKVPCTITALITREAVEDLEISKGDHVSAVIKSTEVMVSKET